MLRGEKDKAVDNSGIRVVVGMSGGVDSSVSTLLLRQQGLDIVSAFMKDWDDTGDSGICTAAKDYEDVKKVVDGIGIPYYSINSEKDYWEQIFEYFLSGYKKDRAPNPGVMCDKEVKFKSFLDFAMDLDADYIIIGHYTAIRANENDIVRMMRPKDSNRDQTYFLGQLSQDQLKEVIFPLANLAKPQMREITVGADLATAKKKDSAGIRFIGEHNFKKFLSEFLPTQSGKMVTPDEKVVGGHAGLVHYTISQRSGPGLGPTKELTGPWSVVGKDLKKNELVVERGYGSRLLYTTSLDVSDVSFLAGQPEHDIDLKCTAKFRYRQSDAGVIMHYHTKDNTVHVEFNEPAHAVTLGQTIVFYSDEECLGGATIDRTYQNEKQLQLV